MFHRHKMDRFWNTQICYLHFSFSPSCKMGVVHAAIPSPQLGTTVSMLGYYLQRLQHGSFASSGVEERRSAERQCARCHAWRSRIVCSDKKNGGYFYSYKNINITWETPSSETTSTAGTYSFLREGVQERGSRVVLCIHKIYVCLSRLP